MSKLFVNMSKNKLWFLTFFIGMVFSFAIIKLEASVNESIINDNLTKIIHNIIHHI